MHSAMIRAASITIALMTLTTLFAGCSGSSDKWVEGRPPLYKASGQVMYQGKPLDGALVLYHPVAGDTSAYGTTDAEGRFLLTTYGDNDGAPSGSYKVVVTKMEYEVKATAYDSPDEKAVARIPKPLLPTKYSKQETTDLMADVLPEGNNEATFEIVE